MQEKTRKLLHQNSKQEQFLEGMTDVPKGFSYFYCVLEAQI